MFFYSPKFGSNIDLKPLTSLPDNILEWTAEEVYFFFSAIGYENEANTFLKNNINGLILMLLDRKDFLNSLQLKMGPAIHLYGLVSILHDQL